MTGVDGYTFTGRILAWGADSAAAGALQGTGALGPVDAFGPATRLAVNISAPGEQAKFSTRLDKMGEVIGQTVADALTAFGEFR